MGRKSLREETVQANVINLSWATIDQALRSKLLTEKEKRVIALEVVKKSCPKEINLRGDALQLNVYTVIGELQRSFGQRRDISKNIVPPLVLDSGNGVDKG